MCNIEIAIFAHNEESTIGVLLNDLASQSILQCQDNKVQIRVLCNGCIDRTVEIAHEAIANNILLSKMATVDNLLEGGKSRTWNRFVDNLDRQSSFVIFVDADIRLPDNDARAKLLEDLRNSQAAAVTSRPLKDLRKIRNPLLRVAAKNTGKEHRDGPISGSLYIVRAEAIRKIRLPVPCLVEDGFLSACLLTGLFSHQGQPERVKASRRVSHYFEAPGSLREFFDHDVRLRLGCELNAALYSDLWAAESLEDRAAILRQFSESLDIDRSIDKHLKHPEKSALVGQKVFKGLWDSNDKNVAPKIFRFPFRFMHCLYMAAVRLRAKKLFLTRKFKW